MSHLPKQRLMLHMLFWHTPEVPENIWGRVDYFESHNSDLFSLEQTLIHELTEYFIHNFRVSHKVVSRQRTYFSGEKVGQCAES